MTFESIHRLKRGAIRRMPFLPRLLEGTFWNSLAMGINQGGTFLISILVARTLGRSSFGQFAMVQSTLMTVSGLAQMGVGSSVTKHLAEFRLIDREKAGRIIGLCSLVCPTLGLFGALIIALAAPALAVRELNSPQLTLPLALGAIFVFFSTANAYQMGALVGMEQYNSLVIPGILSTLITIVMVISGALLDGLVGTVAALSGGMAVRCYLHHRALASTLRRLNIRPSYSGLREELHIFHNFAIPAALSGYLILPCTWYANSLLVRQDGGYSNMAAYSAAQNLRTIVMIGPYLMNSVGLAILNNVRRAPESGTYRSVRKMNMLALISFACCTAVVVALFGKILLSIFGKSYGDVAYPILLVLLLSTISESAFLALYQDIQATGRMWTAFLLISVPWQAAFVVFASILIPAFRGIGLAAAYLIGATMALISTAVIVRFTCHNSAIGVTSSDYSESTVC